MPTVRTFAQLRIIIGKDQVDIPGYTTFEVLENLIQKYPKLENILIAKKNPLELQGHWDVLINDVIIAKEADFWQKTLKNTDVITFVPLIGGG